MINISNNYDQLNLFNYSHDIDVDSVSKCEASNQQEFQIVSPPMPCGVAWLINVLLELGVKTTHHGKEYHNNHWTTDDGVNCKITPKAKDHLLWHLPVLSKQDYFEFVPGKEIRWEHRLDFAVDHHRPTILFTRDGRDAVYSQYRRHHANNMTFEEELCTKWSWPWHFPEMFSLPDAETWGLFNLFWLEMGKIVPIYLVRFEDVKSNPVSVIKGVLSFIGVSRSDQEILRAIESSSFEKSKAQEHQTSLNLSEKTRENHRRGQPFEWKEHYTTEQMAAFRGIANEALYKLGYEPVEQFKERSEKSRITIAQDSEIQGAFKMRSLSKVLQLIENKAIAMDDIGSVYEILAERKAMEWTYYIFNEDYFRSAAAAISQSVFTRLLKDNLSSEHIECLLRTLSRKDQKVSCINFKKKFLYKFRGYSIFQFGRELLAISPTVERNHDISNNDIIQLQKEGKYFVHSDEENLKTVLDDFLNTILEDATKLVKRNLMREAITVIKKGVYLTGAKDKAILDFVDQLMEAKD